MMVLYQQWYYCQFPIPDMRTTMKQKVEDLYEMQFGERRKLSPGQVSMV